MSESAAATPSETPSQAASALSAGAAAQTQQVAIDDTKAISLYANFCVPDVSGPTL